MKRLLQDLKHAFRIYRRTPVSSGVAILVLAVAMAFVTAFLSLYVDIALRPHAGFEQSGRLITLGQTDGRALGGLPGGLIDRMAAELGSVEAVAGIMNTMIAVAEGEEPMRVELVTAGYFPGIRPRLQSGRGFGPADHDPEAAQVAVISYRYWRDQLGGRDVLDTTIELDVQPILRFSNDNDSTADDEDDNNREFRIVGIMAPEMPGSLSGQTAVWLPWERLMDRMFQVPAGLNIGSLRTSLTMQTLGRRSPGASERSVVREIRARYSESTEDFSLQAGYRLDAVNGVVANINVHRDATRQLQLFLGASVLIALVAAANVSLFLLARAPGRRRELGIRMAVGAPLGRLARQLASESGLLVVVAATLGLVISIWLGNLLRGLAFLRQASWRDVSLLDWRVLSLAGVFLLILTVLVSFAPILGLKRLGIAASSRQVAARASLAQRFAGALQISIAGTLAGAAIAFGWTLAALSLNHPGYELQNRYVIQYTINTAGMDPARTRQIFATSTVDLARRREAIEGIPGVTAAAFGTPLPGLNARSWRQIPDPDDPTKQMQLRMGSVDDRYVDVLGLRLIHGRNFADGEANVALVNQALARRFFGREDVVGETLSLNSSPAAGRGPEIVGVLEDLSYEHPSADVEPIIFQLITNTLTGTAIVESSLTAAQLQRELGRITENGELEIRVGTLRPLSELRSTLIAPDRARSWLTIGAAILVVVLAAFGFYGTQRYLVTAGRREYAIRASLGAGPKALGRLILRRGLLLGLPGLVLGLLLSFITVAWLRDHFVSRDVSPLMVTLAVAAGLLLLLLLASLGPARHGMRTQPAPLLRED